MRGLLAAGLLLLELPVLAAGLPHRLPATARGDVASESPAGQNTLGPAGDAQSRISRPLFTLPDESQAEPTTRASTLGRELADLQALRAQLDDLQHEITFRERWLAAAAGLNMTASASLADCVSVRCLLSVVLRKIRYTFSSAAPSPSSPPSLSSSFPPSSSPSLLPSSSPSLLPSSSPSPSSPNTKTTASPSLDHVIPLPPWRSNNIPSLNNDNNDSTAPIRNNTSNQPATDGGHTEEGDDDEPIRGATLVPVTPVTFSFLLLLVALVCRIVAGGDVDVDSGMGAGAGAGAGADDDEAGLPWPVTAPAPAARTAAGAALAAATGSRERRDEQRRRWRGLWERMVPAGRRFCASLREREGGPIRLGDEEKVGGGSGEDWDEKREKGAVGEKEAAVCADGGWDESKDRDGSGEEEDDGEEDGLSLGDELASFRAALDLVESIVVAEERRARDCDT
ncbi:uncharacterized protein THITE_2115764 [Thermothielavioides terrestris NRRL 8126]|uniref:Uncharacterized protein n=1 Tax=Thermothielavioides terrestris (strain ATCC 38088 / NRRL 8126) TaxID=578455 RepID=G2QYD7_THETT|nr:uncharacterized protein THITE_2115764 [Thermothielavioides terrestris NRRL 8126]AEO67033.1 hypothetical protein THITE_2115764 [Thermothielavioides terrestris NRRL 8126]